MSHLFFNPRQARVFNEYDNPLYHFKGDVKSFIYRIWDTNPSKDDGIKSFNIPDCQYYVKLNEFGSIEFIETYRDSRSTRDWVGVKYYGKPGIEQPISYYKQFYHGGISLIYDSSNRIIEKINDRKFKEENYGVIKDQFSYDASGNLFIENNYAKYTFDDFGNIISIIEGQESDEHYSKFIYEYDTEGRIIKRMEYGYDSGEDHYGEHIYLVKKGILLLNIITSTYTNISENEIECLRQVYFPVDNKYRKHVIIYDINGFKKVEEHYYFDGKISETNYFNYTFDEVGNWIKATIDIAFKNEKPEYRHTYEREICYLNDENGNYESNLKLNDSDRGEDEKEISNHSNYKANTRSILDFIKRIFK